MSHAEYELHVRRGAQQGARMRLGAGRAVHVGAAIDSDVVLRGGGPDTRFVLTADGARLHLQVLQGELTAGTHALGPGQGATVALDTPLQLADACIAVERVAPDACADEAATGPQAAPDAATLAASVTRFAARGGARRLAGGGAALAAAAVSVLAFVYLLAPAEATPQQRAERAQALLAGAGLQGLKVSPLADRSVQVEGRLHSAQQLARAEELLARERLAIRWQIAVDEQVAARVQDVFRTNGMVAQVQPTGPGAVRVVAATADPLAAEGVASVARRDVAGLANLELRTHPPAADVAPRPVDDPGKRVASIVAGDPAYVVTADGTRYFLGAMLPTGHRIAAIEEHQVVLELNGVRTPLVF
jgi:type III secretion protein D